jgi:catechol 2,3-dioxygenase-like lactoylglutathione lyase family enzyme
MTVAQPAAVTLDCPDPKALADFYQQMTGMELIWSDDNTAYLATESGYRIGFQKVARFQAPQWPEGDVPQQSHLDFSVTDLEAAEEQILKMGASRPDFQPGGDQWRVLLDPAGHPFCITNTV